MLSFSKLDQKIYPHYEEGVVDLYSIEKSLNNLAAPLDRFS